MLDGAIFAGCVHGLKNQEHRPAILRIELVLKRRHFRNALLEQFFGMFFGTEMPRGCGIKVLQAKVLAPINAIRLGQFAGPAHGSSLQLESGV